MNILYFDLGIGDDYIYHGKTEFHGLNSREIIGKDHEKVQKLIPKGAKHNAIEIFPEYYLIQVEKYQNVVIRAIDEWVYWFKNDKIKEGSSSKNIKKVEKKLNLLKMSRQERDDYETYLGKLASLRDMFETTKEEGIEEGIKKAEKKLKPIIQQKEREVRQKEQEVRQKNQALLNSAKIMKQANIPITQIQTATGLSKDEIEKL